MQHFEDPHLFVFLLRIPVSTTLLSFFFFFLQTNSDRLAPQVYRIYQKLLLNEAVMEMKQDFPLKKYL